MFRWCLDFKGTTETAIREAIEARVKAAAGTMTEALYAQEVAVAHGKKVVIVLCATPYWNNHSAGKLNRYMAEVAQQHLTTVLGCEVKTVEVDDIAGVRDEDFWEADGTTMRIPEAIERHIETLTWADVVIYQQPMWWMSGPYHFKRWMDLVITCGRGRLWENDGRTRSDASKQYGSGGLGQGKQYMLSMTCNTPDEALYGEGGICHGLGMDYLQSWLHASNQYMGRTPLKTFVCTDVIKNPDVPAYTDQYKEHLSRVFGATMPVPRAQ